MRFGSHSFGVNTILSFPVVLTDEASVVNYKTYHHGFVVNVSSHKKRTHSRINNISKDYILSTNYFTVLIC